MQSSLALWNLDSESELIYDADSAIGSTSANGASKRHGIEWNNHYVLNDWLLVDADLAWTHARYANENDNGELRNFIPNAVSKVASVGFTVHDLKPWSGDVKLRYIGKYPLSQDGTLVGPSAVVTNLRIQREINSWASLSLDVLNVFNRNRLRTGLPRLAYQSGRAGWSHRPSWRTTRVSSHAAPEVLTVIDSVSLCYPGSVLTHTFGRCDSSIKDVPK